jgi:hypothetical protein
MLIFIFSKFDIHLDVYDLCLADQGQHYYQKSLILFESLFLDFLWSKFFKIFKIFFFDFFHFSAKKTRYTGIFGIDSIAQIESFSKLV